MKGIEEREEAEIATFTPEELREYEDSLKAYRDIKNSIDTARKVAWKKKMPSHATSSRWACRFLTSQRPQACRKRKLRSCEFIVTQVSEVILNHRDKEKKRFLFI